MAVNDTSIDVAAVVTENRVLEEALPRLPRKDKPRGNTVPLSDERDVWLAILSDWIGKARAAGLDVEVFDLRPTETGFSVVVGGSSYHADGCNTISRGNVCHKCGTPV